jgi:hypothetical protein
MMVAFFPAFPLRLVWNGFTRYHHLTNRENFLPVPKIHTLNGLPPTGYVQSRMSTKPYFSGSELCWDLSESAIVIIFALPQLSESF